MVDLPHQIGPCQLVELGALVAIRRPSDLDGILRRAGRRGNLEVGDGSCRPRVPPRWSRSSAAAPIRCSGGRVSIWTTNRAGEWTPQRAARVGPTAYLGAIGAQLSPRSASLPSTIAWHPKHTDCETAAECDSQLPGSIHAR